MSKNNGPKKEFAPSVGFWPTKNRNGYTCYIDEKTLETLNKATEGGRLFLQAVPKSDNPKVPAYRLTFFDDAPQQQQDEAI